MSRCSCYLYEGVEIFNFSLLNVLICIVWGWFAGRSMSNNLKVHVQTGEQVPLSAAEGRMSGFCLEMGSKWFSCPAKFFEISKQFPILNQDEESNLENLWTKKLCSVPIYTVTSFNTYLLTGSDGQAWVLLDPISCSAGFNFHIFIAHEFIWQCLHSRSSFLNCQIVGDSQEITQTHTIYSTQ